MKLIDRMKVTLFLVAAAAFAAACSTTEPAPEKAAAEPTEPPFSNAEPERYQAVIVQTTGQELVKFRVVRDGNLWRIDSAYGEPGQTSSIHTDKEYVISFAGKAYGEYTAGHGFDERPQMVQEISGGMLNSREAAVFEKIGSEGGLTRYRMTDDKGVEAVITFDEGKGLPIRKESQKMTVTLEDLSLEPDVSLFEIPKDLRKVPMDEMKKILIAQPVK